AIKVLRVQVFALGMREEIIEQHVELLRRELAVLLPPDRLFGLLVANYELVLRRAAAVRAGLGAECPAFANVPFLGGNRRLVELLRWQIPVHRGEIFQAELVGAVSTIP